MAKIDSAYDYYVSTYANKEVSRYDSHKKSDLRKVYNNIVKSNKESPLYKISDINEAKKYAIDIKESAKELQNVVASLSDSYGGFEDSFQKRVAVSSDSDTVGVKYIGDGTEENSAEEFDIQIHSLAMPQINMGNFLESDSLSFAPGNYSFDLNTTSSAYEFQFTVSRDETNEDILNKLSKLVNTSNLGITADVLHNSLGDSALKLTSVQTGLAKDETELFTIAASGTKDSMTAMGLLGINNVASEAQNSDFSLNGNRHSSLSNTFTINNTFELTLKQASPEGKSATIGFKTNVDAVADNIQGLLDAFNGFISVAKDYESEDGPSGRKLLNDISSLSKSKQATLEYVGLMVNEDGSVSIDKDILAGALRSDRADDTFETLSSFKDSIGEKASNMSVNPMNYVNKVVVAYKNPGRNFNTPYISSIYSGMMLDNSL